MIALGIDIGGSGIKGALVDTKKGEMITDRLRIPTPKPAKPKAVIKVLKRIVDHFEYSGPIGVGIPAIVINGVTHSAANIDDKWIGYSSQQAMAEATGCPVTLANDADVAGVAVMRFGAGKGKQGTVMIFTLGTGIGSAVFVDGRLVPNTELGHLYLRNQKNDAENYAAERIREEKNLSWKQWGQRLNTYFQHIEFLFSPELIIIGGGVSKKHEEFLHYIKIRAEIVPAELRNEAGIVGAAVLAAESV
ncbi:polyphosphate--glucose phosphotransferase [Candidatus Leptofilum sp.]|uniref:polyphosphate--glucose phosphotransferase n=1 Tax=Candidatus Leptofilum sp. TaxID=3241576 RepID=UPI003B59FD65